MSIKKGLKKSRKVLLAICLPVLAVIIAVAAIVGAVLGTGENRRLPAGNLADGTTAVNSTTINLGSKINTDNRNAVQELINYVAGSTSVSYNELSSDMDKWKGSGSLSSQTTGTKTADKFKSKTVTLGGVVWNVMYVSKADYTANGTEKGDIIVTLWQAQSDASYMSAYTPWYDDTPNAKYPSAMYGSSKVRSSLVGTSYVATNGATTLTGGSQDSHWSVFTTTSTPTTNGLGEMLATPANMAWQKTQYSNDGSNSGYQWYFPNDAWDASSLPASNWGTSGWYQKTLSSSTVNYNYSDNTTETGTVYQAWKNDKLWLPSMVETGWGASYTNKYGTAGSGIWNADADQRKTNVTTGNAQYCWLRSGNDNYAYYAYLLNSSGSNNYNYTTDSYAVRPALHLNLKSAAKAAGLLEQEINYFTSYGTAPAGGKYAPGTATLGTLTGTIPTGLEFNDWAKGSVNGTLINNTLTGQNESKLDLYATFKPTAATAAATTSKNIEVYRGATDVKMSAAVTHALIGSKFTVSTRWTFTDMETGVTTDVTAGNGITITDGANPSLTFEQPTRAHSGTYTLYYKLQPTADEAARGVKPSNEIKVDDFVLTVYGALATVVEKPTLNKAQIYVGQSIVGTQLVGGLVTTASNSNVAGTWNITSTGVFTSSKKITAEFIPDDNDIAPVHDVEIDTGAIQLNIKLDEIVSNIEGATPFAQKTINVDYGSTVTFSISGGQITFNVVQDGAQNAAIYTLTASEGYTPYLHRAAAVDPDKTQISNGSTHLANITANKLFAVSYTPNNVAYKVYYILDDADTGEYPAATSDEDLEGLIGGGLVYRYDGTAPTGSVIKYLDEDGKPLNASLAAVSNISQRSLDTVKTGTVGKVKGNGTSVQRIYLKLNEYTVSYTASGANPSIQTQTYKYGAIIKNEGITEPVKDMNSFAGWYYDDEFTRAVNFGVDTVGADTQLYAKFDTKHYKIIFDLNIGSESNQLPGDKVPVVNSYNLYSNKVLWNVESLFADSFDFKSASGVGRYEIDYTVNNVTANKSITGIKPSAIGYTFGGWYAEGSSAQSSVIRRPNSGTEDVIVLVAKWTPASYTMRFDKQDGSRITTKTVRNMSPWGQDETDLEPGTTGAILPVTPARSGYVFQGWYITTVVGDHYNDVYNASTLKDENGNWLFSIFDFANTGIYGTAATGFNFSSLTVYAIWKSVDIEIVTVSEHGGLSFYRDDVELSSTDTVCIGDVITVEIDVDNGYEFKNLIVGGRALSAGITTFTIAERNVVSGKDEYDEDYNYITVEAVYVEERYTIQYDTDGGKAADSTFARTYTASNIGSDSTNRAKLPSLLTKRGYDFAGWIFKSTEDEETPDTAYETDGADDDLYGVDLWLKKPYDGEFRNVVLKAVWTAQKAEVYLYNATYSGVYVKDSTDSSRYAIHDYDGDDIVTDMTIEIINPSRGESFVFLGWAVTRNGAVVYPVEDGKNTISYRAFAHRDEKGNLLNLNNLYAVWHVAGIDYVIMSATNNNCTYGGAGITMSAKPARNYESDTSADITLNYKWYKIFEGRYDECFEVKDYEDKDGFKWYVDESGNIVAYEDAATGKFYDEHKTNEITQAQAEARGTKLTYKEFKAVSGACVLKSEQTNRKPGATITYNVKNVDDCGIYICVVEVVATEQNGGSTSKTGGYGEVEIAMNKAVYNGLSMANKKVTYNSTARGDEIAIAGLPVSVENGLKTITLPDGSKVNVNYTYFALSEDGAEREEITDVNDIKNVGNYAVVASFSFAVGGDKGNYEELEELEAELTISADILSMLEFGFVHGDERSTTKFNDAYDGSPYSVDVAIKDTLNINSGSVLVTDADDVYAVVKVYKITENGDVEVTGDTVDAGMYAVVVTGLDGEAADNYVLAGGLVLRKEYTIDKRVYDVAGHIRFDDAEVVFDHEMHALTVKVDNGYEMPSTVAVSYAVDYDAEEADFTEGRLSNVPADKNGGRYAGIYTVTVTFTDSAADNYEELESITATLTIKKAKFFEFYNKDGADLLRDGGFVNGSYSYIVNTKYNPHISGTILSDSEHFSITYEYYRVSETQRDRTMLGSGTYEQLVAAGNLISLAGKYEIVALIKYESPLYRNNFEEIDESESTITYVIRNVNVEKVEVVAWADGFNMEAKLGAAFDYSWIKQINVTYVGDAGTLEVTSAADIALAGITLEKKNNVEQTTFWHTGAFNIRVSFYGTESVEYEFSVIEEVQNVVLKYGTGSGTAVPEEGLEMLTDGTTYTFFIEYIGTDVHGNRQPLTSEVGIAAGGLVLGKNVLTVSEDYYTFADELSVNIYKVIASVIWEYSLDGTTWNVIPEGGELVYAGREYQVRAKFEDGGVQYADAHTDPGLTVLNANANGYLMQVGRSGNYKVTAEYSLVITRKVLEFTWDTSELEYNTWHRSPTVLTSGLEEADKDYVTFGYEFYSDGELVTTDRVVGVGEYEVTVVLRGDATVRNNYTLEGSATATQKFKIVKADVDMTVVYSESNYGENVTFAGNPQGLRLSALKANFGENPAVDGKFTFIKNYVEATGAYDVVEDEKQLASLIANQGYATVWYLYEPNDENFNDVIGSVTITVLQQTAKSGAGALCVELGDDAIPFYLLNQEFDTHGIEVYRLYDSAYQERGRWYGLRVKVDKPSFRIVINNNANIAANGYRITAQDLANEKVVLKALSGSDSGTLDIPVVEKTPTKLEVSSTNHRTVYYVGETPDFADIEFRVLFGTDENPQEGLKIGAVKTTFDLTITEAGSFTVVFTYFTVPCEVTFTAKAKENLQIEKPVNTVLTYRGGEVLETPEIGFTVDGVKYGQNQLDGVKVTVAVYKDGKLAKLAAAGEYTVRYSFAITNPRFNPQAYVDVPVTVTTNPYKVDITARDGESTSYTGEPIAIPKPEVGAVTDSTDGDAELPANRVLKVYTLNGKEIDINKASDWLVVNRGTYEVEVTVKVLQTGSEPYTAKTFKYTFTVTQAENDLNNAGVEAKNVVLGESANFDFKVTADFGASTAVLEYGISRDGVYTTERPTTAGTYYVRAKIAETNNYKGLTTLAVPFEVRNAGLDAGESGSISGGNGVGADWTLEINQMNAEAVSKESISKQNVLTGYEVVLKNGNGVAVSGEGEYTVRIKLTDELKGRKDLNVYFVDASGKSTKMKATVEGDYVSIKMSSFDGKVIITNAVPGEPVGLLVAVIVLGVVAAAGIAACIIVFVKKKKKGAEQ